MLREKTNAMNTQKLSRECERETERDRENRREEGNCRKGGSLVRHYPQSNPQFQVKRNTEGAWKKLKQTRTERRNNHLSNVYVVENFSPCVQLSTSGLFTLPGSARRAHGRQLRHGSHTISPYTPRMTNPLSPCHTAKLTLG